MSPPARVFRPPNRLALLVEQPGGLPRSLAVQRAQLRLAAQRPPAMQAIAILIATLVRMADDDGPLLPGELPQLRRVAGKIVSLALIFEQDALAQAGMRFCDLIAAFAGKGQGVRGALQVHVRALQLFAPGRRPADGEIRRVLGELDRVLAFFNAAPPPA